MNTKELRRLATSRGCELELWDVSGANINMKGKTIMSFIWGTYYSVGLTITKKQALAMAEAALQALPAAESLTDGLRGK